MISRAVFADTLAQLDQEHRARIAAERALSELRQRIAAHGIAARAIADEEIRTSRRPTCAWARATAEQAATLAILQQD